MRTNEGDFTSIDGTRLFARDWRPDAAPKAAVLIIHGYAEHSRRYAWTAEQLARRGYAVSAFDFRGHGKSVGERVLIRSMNEYLDDVDAALARLVDAMPELPVFLLGHSMGGGVLALYATARIPRGAARDRVCGLVFSGAVLPADGNVFSNAALGLVERMGRLLPALRVRDLAAASVSRDPAVVADYDADPLNYRGKMPLGLLSAMVRGGRFVDKHMGEIRLPMLVLHGEADQLTSPEASRRFCERAGSSDKLLKIYDGLYHEILNEPEKDIVIEDIGNWLDRQLANTAPPPGSPAATSVT